MTQQEALKNFLSNKLQENSFNVDFRVGLYNREGIDYYDIEETGQKKRFVPTTIEDIVGEYINIPNANSTSNDTSIFFDIFVDYQNDDDETSDKERLELENVQYNDTLNAIEEFKSSLLAQYFPLGTPYLYMGGEDSTFSVTSSSNIAKFFYIKFIPYNNDEETILESDATTDFLIYKDATNISFDVESGVTISVPYTVNEEIEVTIYQSGGDWFITNGTDIDSVTNSTTSKNYTSFTFGNSTGFEGLVKRIVIDNDDSASIDDVEDAVVDISTWPNKSTIENSGEGTIVSSSINNSILWSEDGNAIFGFGTLSPTTGIRVVDGSYIYQGFELPVSAFISNDVLFGNNFEYYLDGERIYPIDRQHSLGTEVGSAQYINSNENEHIVEESSRDHTLSFYYIPNKKLNSLLKHVVSGNTAQNTTYTLLVQYPFFKVSYEVLLDTGGTQPNINTLSTFTVTFKKSDSNL